MKLPDEFPLLRFRFEVLFGHSINTRRSRARIPEHALKCHSQPVFPAEIPVQVLKPVVWLFCCFDG